MAEYIPLFEDGAEYPRPTSQALVGGQVVAVSGSGTVGVAGANAINWCGVAAFDAAVGDIVTIYSGGIQRLVASGGITAGDLLVCAANGQVSTLAAVTTPTAADVTNSRAIIGVALTTVTTGNLVEVQILR